MGIDQLASGGDVPDDLDVDSLNTGELTLTPPRENPFVSTEPDFSDVTIHHAVYDGGETGIRTPVSISDGPKTVIGLGGTGFSYGSEGTDGAGEGGNLTVEVDGTSNVYPSTDGYFGDDQSDSGQFFTPFFPFIYKSSLSVSLNYGFDNADKVTIWAFVKGSGPNTAVEVADGESALSVHRSMSRDQIDQLNPTVGEIVTNPDGMDTGNIQTELVWDANDERFVQP